MTKGPVFTNMSEEELKFQEQDLKREIFKLSNEMRMSRKCEKPHLLRKLKKDRARILMTISAKEQKEGI